MTTDNLNDDAPPSLPAEGTAPVAATVEKAPAKAKAKVAKAAEVVTEDTDRVTIIVDEPNNAPSNQQFFGLNGKGFLITFGEKVRVPRELLNVLNECVETRSIPQEGGGVVERDVLRFPYRIVG